MTYTTLLRRLQFLRHRRFVRDAASYGFTPAPGESWDKFRRRVQWAIVRRETTC